MDVKNLHKIGIKKTNDGVINCYSSFYGMPRTSGIIVDKTLMGFLNNIDKTITKSLLRPNNNFIINNNLNKILTKNYIHYTEEENLFYMQNKLNKVITKTLARPKNNIYIKNDVDVKVKTRIHDIKNSFQILVRLIEDENRKISVKRYMKIRDYENVRILEMENKTLDELIIYNGTNKNNEIVGEL